MEFKQFGALFNKSFNERTKNKRLFQVEIDKEEIWDVYLNSFPEETRQSFNCNCCRRFIQRYGGIVTIESNLNITSIWDVEVEDSELTNALKALNEYVKNKQVINAFYPDSNELGTQKNYDSKNMGHTWYHFFLSPVHHPVVERSDLPKLYGNNTSTIGVFKRALEEFDEDSINVVIELIKDNNLYRGAEYSNAVTEFKKLFDKYKAVPQKKKNNFLWSCIHRTPNILGIRNTVIGTLIQDLVEGKSEEEAVKAYEHKTAPTNYKRPKALVTKCSLEVAKAKLEELGYERSIYRCYARPEDLHISNIIYAHRDVEQSKTDIWADMGGEVALDPKKIDGKEIGIDDFISNIVPKANFIDVLLENRHNNNLMSLIAPLYKEAPSMFKWSNGFSWCYNNNVTDSIKEKVKNAGGEINADVRVSLAWYNYDDLDLHVKEPTGNEIFYSNKKSRATGGFLDVDMNAGGGSSRSAVENVVWKDKRKMKDGTYEVIVHNYAKRESIDTGFEIECEIEGRIVTFQGKALQGKEKTTVFTFTVINGEITINGGKVGFMRSKELWGMKTNIFQRVSLITKSPNFWDKESVGNEHTFFILEKAHNKEGANGFFNEFLNDKLRDHKRVFELMSSKMNVEDSHTQLSGVGFSSTKRDNVICAVQIDGKKQMFNVKF